MIRNRLHWKIWLVAPAAVAATVFGLVAPAQAQPASPARTASALTPAKPASAARPATTPTASKESLQSLVGHAPAAGKRWPTARR